MCSVWEWSWWWWCRFRSQRLSSPAYRKINCPAAGQLCDRHPSSLIRTSVPLIEGKGLDGRHDTTLSLTSIFLKHIQFTHIPSCTSVPDYRLIQNVGRRSYSQNATVKSTKRRQLSPALGLPAWRFCLDKSCIIHGILANSTRALPSSYRVRQKVYLAQVTCPFSSLPCQPSHLRREL
jgi:hypothetical protein